MVNKVMIIGNVGKDPEIKEINGTKVANFSVVTTERGFTTKEGKEIPERTEWHNIVIWGGLCNVIEAYVKKGTQVYLEGKIRTRSYEDKDGNKRYSTEIYADIMNLLGSKQNSTGDHYTGVETGGHTDPPF